MLGRKVATYSRLRPFAKGTNGKGDTEAASKRTEQVAVNEDKATHQVSYEERLISTISASIKQLDIELSPTQRSRKSEIRPRLSIAPTKEEYTGLLECCQQDRELPFDEWFSEMKEQWGVCVKIGESSFSEVFKMTNGEDSVAVKVMPLLRPGTTLKEENESPEPIQLTHLLHEIRSLQALESLRMERKYAIPTGYTGFNRLAKYVPPPPIATFP